jgi:hypothetical protein
MLICRPVSRRSAPQKIQSWISDMEKMRLRHSHDPEACHLIDRCIRHASQWLAPQTN